MSLMYEEPHSRNRVATLALGFAGGVASVLLLQLANGSTQALPSLSSTLFRRHADMYPRQASESFPADIGSTEVHQYPPTSPTNDKPNLFPTQIGFAGGTATGAEAAIAVTATAYPTVPGTAGLVKPGTWNSGSNDTPSWIDTSDSSDEGFNIFQNWGNLSPYYSVKAADFGLPNASPEVPYGCELTGVHILHRHGARYPTGPSKLPIIIVS
jgi:hypothetical protein